MPDRRSIPVRPAPDRARTASPARPDPPCRRETRAGRCSNTACASATAASVRDSPNSSRSRSPSLICSRAFASSQPSARALSWFTTIGCAAVDRRHARRQLPVHDEAPARANAEATRRQQRLGLRQGLVPGRRAADADARRPLGPGIRVAQVAPGHRAGEQRAIGDAAGHDSHSIKAFRHQFHAEPVDRPEARLVADHAAIGRRPDHAARGLGAVGERKEPVRHAGRRPAARAARRMLQDCAGCRSAPACAWRTRW